MAERPGEDKHSDSEEKWIPCLLRRSPRHMASRASRSFQPPSRLHDQSRPTDQGTRKTPSHNITSCRMNPEPYQQDVREVKKEERECLISEGEGTTNKTPNKVWLLALWWTGDLPMVDWQPDHGGPCLPPKDAGIGSSFPRWIK
ncbi:uncharacterized protein [Paramormyrops kingsleyae]|uniref:uncharacterized protein isoform X3 n=1 Tax=Paramormyrops kingsleyae TaxID=1676925 RepID=UPI003B973AC3